MSGLRYNENKRRWGLLPFEALAELVKVLEMGAAKYGDYNWQKGLSWTQTFESLQRHLLAWYNGEDKDAESGLSHIAHVLANAIFLMHFILTKTGTDDRNNKNNKEVKDIERERRLAEYEAIYRERVAKIKRQQGLDRLRDAIRQWRDSHSHPGTLDNPMEQRWLSDDEENLRSENKS